MGEPGGRADTSAEQQVLVELAHWLGRVQQYSLTHPASTQLGDRFHATLTAALELRPELVYGITRDGVMIGDVPATHPAVRGRIAAHLHDRGVLLLRFLRGVARADLHAFVELAILPAQAIFDRGGLVKLFAEHAITRVQVEELVHEISEEELESGRRRRRLREFFLDALRKLLARRDLGGPIGEILAELLDHPQIAVTILEDQGAGIAEAAAGMALLVRQEERRTGQELAPKLRAIFAALAPMARDRLLLGYPPLVGEFRAALAWAMRGYREPELARFVFPALRARAHELDVLLYALSVLVPHDGTRLSTLRRTGAMLHDLPLDDSVAASVLAAIARPVDDFESYRRERLCLLEPATHAANARALAALALAPETPVPQAAAGGLGTGAIRQIVRMAAGTKQFERFCRRLPDAAGALAADGAGAALLELCDALAEVDRPEWRELAVSALQAVASGQAAELLAELEGHNLTAAEAVARRTPLLRLVAAGAPKPALDHLDLSKNAPLRQLLLEHLPAAGPRLVPLLRARLTADAPPSVVELIGLLTRTDGRADDLAEVARHRDDNVRLEVARALRLLPPSEKGTELLVRYQANPSPRTRVAVRVTLRGDLLGPGAIAGVARLLADAEQPEEVHRRLVQALGQSSQDAAAQLLYKTLLPHGLIDAAPVVTLRDLAAVALRHCPAPAAAKLFEEALASTSRRVRKACERAVREAP